MAELSLRRKQILDFITKFIEEKNYAPSVRDVVKGCAVSSSSTVQYHLSILERDGHILRHRDISRSISLSRRKRGVVNVPLLGAIAAGEPIPVPRDDAWAAAPQEMVEVTQGLTSGSDRVYALKVKGTSMIDALIDDGDTVLMQQASTAEDGEMVAVWLRNEQEVTLKRIYREPGLVRLEPANRQMKPTYHSHGNVQIQGRVVGVIRKVTPIDDS